MENSRDVSVGDLIYGSDAYYGQVTRVGGSVVEFTTVGLMPAGPKGDQGDQGPEGPQGPKGDKGDQGNLDLLDLPITELNNHSLREVFEDGNLVVNGYFKNGLEPSLIINATGGVLDNIVTLQSTEVTGRIEQEIDTIIGNRLYYFATVKTDSNQVGLSQAGQLERQHSGSDTYELLSFIYDNQSSKRYPQVIDYRYDNFANIYIKNLGVIDLSVLGISHLTVSQMDYWFNVYQELSVSDTNAIFSMFALRQQEEWITPTLLGGATGTIQYMKDTLGFVHFRGNVKMPVGASTAFMYMPVGYRVKENYIVPAYDNIKNMDGNSFLVNSGACYVSSGVPGSEFNGTIMHITYQGE